MIKAIVPMKGHSERLPGKNVQPLGGKPLFHHLIRTLLGSCIDQVIVDTDSEAIGEAVNAYFPEVVIDRRPAGLCYDTVGGNELLGRFVQDPDDIYVQSHVTCPFLTKAAVEAAVQKVIGGASSVFSVSRITQRVWSHDNWPINHKPYEPTARTQDLPPVFMENAGFFIFRGSFFLADRCRNTPKSEMFEIGYPEDIDIDTLEDLQLAEAVMQALQTRSQTP